MDGFALTMVLALAALSCVPADWENDGKSALRQVLMMACGLILLIVYIIFRAYLGQ
jgi:hypothetical protein